MLLSAKMIRIRRRIAAIARRIGSNSACRHPEPAQTCHPRDSTIASSGPPPELIADAVGAPAHVTGTPRFRMIDSGSSN
jgi:hypothetical protein